MKLEINPLPLSRFRWERSTKTLAAFASDLPGFRLERLYDDACDVGIAVRSERTGAEVRFCLEREEARDGDFLAWHFVPADRICPPADKLIIFND